MESQQTTVVSSTPPPISDSSSNGWIYVGIGLAIILILIGAFVIYWYLFRKPPTPVNTVCSSQSCPKGQYCNSLGACVTGTGDNVGQVCAKNADCVYGYNCVSQRCISNIITPVTNLPAQFQLMYTLGNSKTTYYLDPSTSSITQTAPTTNFSYDHVNQILSINGGSTSNNKVNVSTKGTLSSSTTGFPLTLLGNTSAVSIQYPCGSTLSYKGTSGTSINVFFPQVEKGSCPATFLPSSGSIPITFSVQSMPVPPTTVNIQLNESQMNNMPQTNWSSLNNNNMPQTNWSSLNNNMPQNNCNPLNNNMTQSNWSSLNNLPDTSMSANQNLFMQPTFPGEFTETNNNAGWNPVNINF